MLLDVLHSAILFFRHYSANRTTATRRSWLYLNLAVASALLSPCLSLRSFSLPMYDHRTWLPASQLHPCRLPIEQSCMLQMQLPQNHARTSLLHLPKMCAEDGPSLFLGEQLRRSTHSKAIFAVCGVFVCELLDISGYDDGEGSGVLLGRDGFV